MELLNDMALFVEVVKVMSFRRAAEITGIPNSTISRRISGLEKAIGLRLMHRTTRKLELTEAGHLYYERCKHIVEEARLAHEQLGNMLAQPAGVLRVSMPVDFAAMYLAEHIADFARTYPGISFEFDLTPRRVDLFTEPFDVAIRIGESENSSLIARAIASFSAELYASPEYLESAGEPKHPEDLVAHQCFHMQREGEWTLQNGKEKRKIPVGGRFIVNSIGMMRRLGGLGMGIILMPPKAVEEDVAAGRLQRVLKDWKGVPLTAYAMTETRLLPAKTQRFIEFLRDRLATTDARLMGVP